MPTPALTVGGTPLYPQAGLLDSTRPVYRPVYGNAGLLSQPKMDNLISNFAGGLLNGYQVGSTPDANGRYFTPIAPSGVYTTNPGDATTVTDNRAPGGSQFTNREMIQMMYGEPTGNGSDWDTFLGFVNTRPKWMEGVLGGSLDADWDRDSEFWKEFMRNANTAIRSRSVGNDGTGGGGGGSGANSGGGASGGAGNPGR
jgi:uncharacterized membrane protein YgcG